jgi:hypothetical protein
MSTANLSQKLCFGCCANSFVSDQIHNFQENIKKKQSEESRDLEVRTVFKGVWP